MLTFYVILSYILTAIVYLISSTVHNYIQARVAKAKGDFTAAGENLLTINPIKHIDWLGFALFLASGIGWAKPVPINEYNFKKPGKNLALTYLSGIGGNLALALISLILLKLLFWATPLIIKVDFLASIQYWVLQFLTILLQGNLTFAILGLIPIPPLDGYHILQGILPKKLKFSFETFEAYSPWIMALILSPYSPIGIQIAYQISVLVTNVITFVSQL